MLYTIVFLGMNQAMETEETETTDASTLPGTAEREEEDVEMQELMQNKEFLQSVLSSLPGVNPEEALQNLQEMTEAAEEQQKEKDGDNQVSLRLKRHSELISLSFRMNHHKIITEGVI